MNTVVKTEAPSQNPVSGSPSTAPPIDSAQSPIPEKDKINDVLPCSQSTVGENSPTVVTGRLSIKPKRMFSNNFLKELFS